MLTDLATLLATARRDRYAVVAPDFVNLGMARSCLEAAEAAGAPLALSYTPAFLPVAETGDYRELIAQVRRLAARARVPVAIHLDHGATVEEALTAIEMGFTSVMFDGSALPDDENARLTACVVGTARPRGVSVEGEIGHVGSGQVYGAVEASAHEGRLTDPVAALRFAAATGVDALAVSIGTAHGNYKQPPHLDFALLGELRRLIPVPLVLHGSSGTGEEQLRGAVTDGICKLNVYTDLVRAVKDAVAGAAASPQTGLAEVLGAADRALRTELLRYFDITASARRY